MEQAQNTSIILSDNLETDLKRINQAVLSNKHAIMSGSNDETNNDGAICYHNVHGWKLYEYEHVRPLGWM